MKKRTVNYSDLFDIKKNWPVYLMAIGVITLISFLFPSTVSFDYKYSQGQKWQYQDIIAPFDYPILKDKVIYNAQVNDAKSSIKDIYVVDPEISSSGIRTLSDQLSKEINISKKDSLFFNKQIISFYENGVVDLKNDNKIIFSVSEESRPRNLMELYTPDDIVAEIEKTTVAKEIAFPEATKEALKASIISNTRLDEALTSQMRNEAISAVAKSSGTVRKGDVVVRKGDVLSDNEINLLNSYKNAYESKVVNERSKPTIFSGYFLLTLMVFVAMLLFIYLNYPQIFFNWRKMAFIMMWPLLFSYLVFAVESTEFMSVYIIPFAIVAIITQNFYDDRLAFFVYIVTILIASFLSKEGYEFAFVQILAGIVVIQTTSETRVLNNFYRLILILFLTYVLSYIGLELIKNGTILKVEWQTLKWFLFNGFLVLLAYPFIPLYEKIFGFTSSITLVELADFNRPLLKKLSIEAPGTFQHSIQVANLAEAATDKIGGNSLLVKTAALYHDIGKMVYPEAFIENKDAYDNPHEEFNNFESAEVIISHVTEGIEMAKKAGLPDVIIDFIRTHHGSTRVEYFYRKQLQDEPDREFDETLFRYPGPKPKTKEQAILMLADSLEAASKSLKSPSGQELDEFIDKIVAGKIAHGQLEESDLTFGELNDCVDTFKSLLRSIYHVRVEYPSDKA